MTHKELLAKVDHNLDKEIWFQDMGYALRAVVELHKPCCDNLNQLHIGYCALCSQTKLTKYPCPTIQAINKELR